MLMKAMRYQNVAVHVVVRNQEAVDLRLLEGGAHNLLEQASTVKSEVQSE